MYRIALLVTLITGCRDWSQYERELVPGIVGQWWRIESEGACVVLSDTGLASMVLDAEPEWAWDAEWQATTDHSVRLWSVVVPVSLGEVWFEEAEGGWWADWTGPLGAFDGLATVPEPGQCEWEIPT